MLNGFGIAALQELLLQFSDCFLYAEYCIHICCECVRLFSPTIGLVVNLTYPCLWHLTSLQLCHPLQTALCRLAPRLSSSMHTRCSVQRPPSVSSPIFRHMHSSVWASLHALCRKSSFSLVVTCGSARCRKRGKSATSHGGHAVP